jgi:hypothetical protein
MPLPLSSLDPGLRRDDGGSWLKLSAIHPYPLFDPEVHCRSGLSREALGRERVIAAEAAPTIHNPVGTAGPPHGSVSETRPSPHRVVGRVSRRRNPTDRAYG